MDWDKDVRWWADKWCPKRDMTLSMYWRPPGEDDGVDGDMPLLKDCDGGGGGVDDDGPALLEYTILRKVKGKRYNNREAMPYEINVNGWKQPMGEYLSFWKMPFKYSGKTPLLALDQHQLPPLPPLNAANPFISGIQILTIFPDCDCFLSWHICLSSSSTPQSYLKIQPVTPHKPCIQQWHNLYAQQAFWCITHHGL